MKQDFAYSFKLAIIIVLLITLYFIIFYKTFTIKNYKKEITKNNIIEPTICYGTLLNCKKINYEKIIENNNIYYIIKYKNKEIKLTQTIK